METVAKQPNSVATPEQTRYGAIFTPRVDILENQEELLMFADLPGVRTEDLDLRYENGELVIHGRCKPRQQEGSHLAQEFGVGDFYRAFSIGEAIDAQSIRAELKRGVLTVHLPKSEEVKPRRIAVKND
jgi:HSP20 family protein